MGRKQLLQVEILMARRFIQWKSWRMSIDFEQPANFIGFFAETFVLRHLRGFVQRPVDIF